METDLQQTPLTETSPFQSAQGDLPGLSGNDLPIPTNRENGIEARHVSKRFQLSTEPVGRMLSFFLHRISSGGHKRELWALRDVSFDIRHGEMLGVLGANGSGKSTLLRLITGIIDATSGEIRRLPRIAALLDLSAGFHPALTGYENLFLNGSIIGLHREELRSKLGEIIRFSGVDPRFLEVPVRTYSSGMMARLGFALAVSCDPDIVLIDEVLAVGDLDFQAKSARRLLEFRDEGKAMALVSHSSSTIQELANHAIWLDHGVVKMDGNPVDVVAAYNSFLTEQVRNRGRIEGIREIQTVTQRRSNIIHFEKTTVLDHYGKPANEFTTGEALTFTVELASQKWSGLVDLMIAVQFHTGNVVDEFLASDRGFVLPDVSGGGCLVELRFDPLMLLEGNYTIEISAVDPSDRETILGSAKSTSFSVKSRLSSFGVYPAYLPVEYSLR